MKNHFKLFIIVGFFIVVSGVFFPTDIVKADSTTVDYVITVVGPDNQTSSIPASIANHFSSTGATNIDNSNANSANQPLTSNPAYATACDSSYSCNGYPTQIVSYNNNNGMFVDLYGVPDNSTLYYTSKVCPQGQSCSIDLATASYAQFNNYNCNFGYGIYNDCYPIILPVASLGSQVTFVIKVFPPGTYPTGISISYVGSDNTVNTAPPGAGWDGIYTWDLDLDWPFYTSGSALKTNPLSIDMTAGTYLREYLYYSQGYPTPGMHTIAFHDIPGYSVTPTCTYSTGGNCLTNGTTPYGITSTNSLNCTETPGICRVYFDVVDGKQSNIVIKYSPIVVNSGDIQIKRVGSDDTTATAPAGTNAYLSNYQMSSGVDQDSVNPKTFSISSIDTSLTQMSDVADQGPSGKNTAHIINFNSPYMDSGGVVGSALSVASAQNQFMESDGYLTGNDFTYSMWVKETTRGTNHWIYSAQRDPSAYNEMISNNGRIQYAVSSGWIDSGYDLPLNTWAHIVLTRSNSGTNMYVNGSLVHTDTSTSGQNFNGTILPFRLATEREDAYTPAVGSFDGLFDEVRVYNKALTPAEVSTLYSNNTSNISSISNLQAYWSFSSATPFPFPLLLASTDNKSGYTVNAGECSGTGCVVSSFNISPACDNVYCSVFVPFTANSTERVVFKYSAATAASGFTLTPVNTSILANPGSALTPNVVSNDIIATAQSGTQNTVNFSVSGLPSGVTANTMQSCIPSCKTRIEFNVSSSASIGTSTITVTGNDGTNSVTATFNLVVTNQTDAKITVCLIVKDGASLSYKTSSVGVPANTVSIPFFNVKNLSATPLFTYSASTASFSPDKTLPALSTGNIMQCQDYSGLPYKEYFYGSSTSMKGYWSATYNDSVYGTPTSTESFVPYAGQIFDSNPTNDGLRDYQADGDIMFSDLGQTRTLYIIAQYESGLSSVSDVTCKPSAPNVVVNKAMTWTAYSNEFTDSFTWNDTNSDATSASDIGSKKTSHNVTYTSTGAHNISVTSSRGFSAKCSVNVVNPSIFREF